MATNFSLTKRIAMYLVENVPNPSHSLGSDRDSRTYTIQRDLSYRRKLWAEFYDHGGKGVEQADDKSYVELHLDPRTNDQFGFLILDWGLKGKIDDPDVIFRVTGISPFGQSNYVQLSRDDWTEKQKKYFQARYDSVAAWFYKELTRKQKTKRGK